MIVTQSQKDQIARLLDNLNIGTKKEEVGRKIIAIIENVADDRPTREEIGNYLSKLNWLGEINE